MDRNQRFSLSNSNNNKKAHIYFDNQSIIENPKINKEF